MSSEQRRILLTRAGGIALTALAGVLLVLTPLGDGLARLSYDLPFLFRSGITVPEVAVVYVDRRSLKDRDVLGNEAWPPDRRIYARLLRRLQAEEASVVVFDFHFRLERAAEDELLAAAIREHGNVVLGGLLETVSRQSGEAGGIGGDVVVPSNQLLTSAAKAWGVFRVKQDHMYAVRQMFTGTNDHDALIWAAARVAEAPVTRVPSSRDEARWLNYYGPARSLDSFSLSDVVRSNIPPDRLRGRVVFVGADSSVTPGLRDEFATPWTRFASGRESAYMPGVELLATGCANLLRGDWIRQVSPSVQAGGVLLWAGALFLLPVWFRPRTTLLIALTGGGCLMVLGICSQALHGLWWNWAALVIVQTPLALLWITKKKPKVAFISYRRGDGGAHAHAILNGLRTRGFDAYLDVDFLGGGPYPDSLRRHIGKVPNFILIVSPTTFDPARINQEDDWIRQEIAEALRLGRRIIPVIHEGVKMPGRESLPPEIAAVADYNGVDYNHKKMGATLDDLISYFVARYRRRDRKARSGRKGHPSRPPRESS